MQLFNTANRIEASGGVIYLPPRSIAESRLQQALKCRDRSKMCQAAEFARKTGETDNDWYREITTLIEE